MNRYIDADALIDAHYEYCNEHSYNANAVFPTWSLSLMQNAPSIDIVHCEECKHRGICFGRLVQGTEVVQLNSCSYGERDSEKPNNCETCRHWEADTGFCYSIADSDDHVCHYEPKDEPQTERSE